MRPTSSQAEDNKFELRPTNLQNEVDITKLRPPLTKLKSYSN